VRRSIPQETRKRANKFASFLEDGRNTDLIRWSDDGNSFIVLDEDEFAKKLIPELFKHNNYASFVRQLNMYGFHKKVGLSDNSMRASEKKNKSPSEYSNPYFRRGCPDLLWLIQKPKNVSGPTSKRKGKNENEQMDDELDDYVEDAAITDNRVRTRPGPLAIGGIEMALTQEQFKSVQRELAAIRHQQSHISRMMQQLKREHEQLYGQAATFQDQHNRHENSINAILTFLATVYNRTLQGHDNAQGIASLFQNAMPVDTSTSGSVVDVGDYNFNDINIDGSPGKPFKRQPLLLTNGTGAGAQQGGRASTLSPRTTASSPYPPRAQPVRPANQHSSLTPQAEEVFDPGVNSPNNNLGSTSASTQSRPSVSDLPSRDMMSMIQSANARNTTSATSPTTPAEDFSSVLDSLQNSSGTVPLTNTQRADMLRMINNTSGSAPGADNALINATPPPGPANFHRRLASTQADLDQLAKLQEQQDKSVQNLTNLLQPLSPTGSIPGIHDSQQLPPPPLDVDDFLNQIEYFADFPSEGSGNYDFGNTGLSGNQQGGDALNFGDYKDDDELFGNLDNNPSAPGFGFDGTDDASQAQYAGNAGSTDVFHEDDGGGRVESVPSSVVTTPKSDADRKSSNGADGAGGANAAAASRAKGRKLSQNEENAGRKRARA
jgi:heat shock transcription factor